MMSDPETTTTPAEDGQPDPAEETSHATEDPGMPDDPADPARKARGEARRLRERLHAAEAERDTLAGVVDGYRRRDAEQAAETAGLASGGDLWAGGTDLADLVDDAGTVDPAKVAEAVAALVAERPHWARRPHGDLDQGPRATAPQPRTWHDALTGR